MFKIRNPHYRKGDPDEQFAKVEMATLDAVLLANADQEVLTYDDIRAAFPAGKRGRMTQGMISEIAQRLGVQVEFDG